MAKKHFFDSTGNKIRVEDFEPEPIPEREPNPRLVPDEITLLQLAVAELAAMIAGGDDNG